MKDTFDFSEDDLPWTNEWSNPELDHYYDSDDYVEEMMADEFLPFHPGYDVGEYWLFLTDAEAEQLNGE